MKPTDLDSDVPCRVCDGTGEEPSEKETYGHCPRCGGDGTINRYRDGDDGYVLLWEEVEDNGDYTVYRKFMLPATSADDVSFEGLFHGHVPSDLPADTNYDTATENRLNDDTDLSVDDAIAWARDHGSSQHAEWLETIRDELNL